MSGSWLFGFLLGHPAIGDGMRVENERFGTMKRLTKRGCHAVLG